MLLCSILNTTGNGSISPYIRELGSSMLQTIITKSRTSIVHKLVDSLISSVHFAYTGTQLYDHSDKKYIYLLVKRVHRFLNEKVMSYIFVLLHARRFCKCYVITVFITKAYRQITPTPEYP